MVRRVAGWGCWVLCAVLLGVLAGSVGVSAVWGGQPVAVTSGSMVPALAPGTLVVNRGVDAATACEQIHEGDVVTYTLYGAGQVTHRVTEIVPAPDREGPACRFTVQGDANAQPDAAVTPEQLRGVMVYALPLLGWVWAGVGPVWAAALLGLLAVACGITGWGLGRGQAPADGIQWAPAPEVAAPAVRAKGAVDGLWGARAQPDRGAGSGVRRPGREQARGGGRRWLPSRETAEDRWWRRSISTAPDPGPRRTPTPVVGVPESVDRAASRAGRSSEEVLVSAVAAGQAHVPEHAASAGSASAAGRAGLSAEASGHPHTPEHGHVPGHAAGRTRTTAGQPGTQSLAMGQHAAQGGEAHPATSPTPAPAPAGAFGPAGVVLAVRTAEEFSAAPAHGSDSADGSAIADDRAPAQAPVPASPRPAEAHPADATASAGALCPEDAVGSVVAAGGGVPGSGAPVGVSAGVAEGVREAELGAEAERVEARAVLLAERVERVSAWEARVQEREAALVREREALAGAEQDLGRRLGQVEVAEQDLAVEVLRLAQQQEAVAAERAELAGWQQRLGVLRDEVAQVQEQYEERARQVQEREAGVWAREQELAVLEAQLQGVEVREREVAERERELVAQTERLWEERSRLVLQASQQRVQEAALERERRLLDDRARMLEAQAGAVTVRDREHAPGVPAPVLGAPAASAAAIPDATDVLFRAVPFPEASWPAAPAASAAPVVPAAPVSRVRPVPVVPTAPAVPGEAPAPSVPAAAAGVPAAAGELPGVRAAAPAAGAVRPGAPAPGARAGFEASLRLMEEAFRRHEAQFPTIPAGPAGGQDPPAASVGASERFSSGRASSGGSSPEGSSPGGSGVLGGEWGVSA